jgi:manganese/zinc/iron transport system permease protein
MTGLWSTLGGHTGLTVVAGSALIGMVAGVLGAFALLRRQSLLGDTLSHAALPGVCAGFLLAGARDPLAILAGALGAGMLAALAVTAIPRVSRLKPDAAMAIVLSGFFAVGVVLLSVVQGLATGAQAGLADFLFGQAAAILRGDLIVMGAVAALCLGLVALGWKECGIVAFDPDLARVQGIPAGAVQAGLTALMALAIVVGLQVVGVVLMVALLIAPAVAARLWAQRLGAMVILSGVLGASRCRDGPGDRAGGDRGGGGLARARAAQGHDRGLAAPAGRTGGARSGGGACGAARSGARAWRSGLSRRGRDA